jgi:hypothetical protein
MATFTGLNPSMVYGFIYNMILRQTVESDDIRGGGYDTLMNEAKEDVGLLGDQILEYATDALEVIDWTGDGEAENLLKLHRPPSPKCQTFTIDTYKMVVITLDNYLTKQAWSTEGAFQQFNNRMLGWLADTQKAYMVQMYNSRVGVISSDEGKQMDTVTVTADEQDKGLFGRVIAEKMANILAEMKDYNTEYNDYHFLRSYAKEDLKIVVPASVANRIRKVELPVVYHQDGLIENMEVLPDRFFGHIVGESGTSTTNGTNTNIRSLVEIRYPVASADADPRAKKANDNTFYVLCRPGDLLPGGVEFNQNEAYYEDQDIAFKVVHRKALPFFSAFSTGTVFWNPRSLTNTHYAIFGYAEPEKSYNYPIVTVKYTEA